MAAQAREARYSVGSATASRSPTKTGGAARRLSSLDTATSGSRRPSTAMNDRPEERVKVFVRVRPTKAEGETPGALRLKPDGRGLVIHREHGSIPSSEFEFDRVLGPEASQSDVYHAAVKPVVEDVLNGYNGTLMAYGQTGAGKTYSLSSIAADAIGMIPRAAAEIFSAVEQDKGHEYSVYMSYVQLYMELIQDLLRPESENLAIRENDGGVFVGGVHQQEVQNIAQCLHLLHLGDRNRTTAFTALNAHSSRSHAVVMLTVIKRRCVAGTGEAEIQRVRVGKLFLVDLAGSERLKKSKSVGLRASEAKSINLSLTTLGMCINARADPAATHVPFRDSKLTRLLQDSLGGNAKTSLLVAACDAAEHVDETLQSLQFGLRAMSVRTQAVVNERVDYCTAHAEMVAALETRDRKSSLLEASLLEKDAQLEAVQARLAQEQQEAAQRLEELRRERQALEAERQRMQDEQAAQLAAEQQHKAALLRQLEASSAEAQGQAAAHEQQRAALQQRVEQQAAQLAEAGAAAAAAVEAHAAELAAERLAHAAQLEAVRAEAAAELAAATGKLREEAAVAAAAAAEQLAAVRAELGDAQRLLLGSREEARILSEHHEQQLKEVEEEGRARVADAVQAGERQVAAVQATVAARDGTIAQQRADLAARDGSLAGLQADLAALEGDRAELARQLAAAHAQLEAAGRLRLQLERALAEERHAVAALHAQVEGYERSRMALAKSFFENKRSSDAAKVIQRHWREHRLHRMRRQQTEGYQALTNAKAALGTLAQQHADLDARRRANLAFSGQTLVGDNLDVLQDAVESIVAAFLLPARDLRSLQRYQQKVSGFAAASTRQSVAYPPGGLSRASTASDLIKASLAPMGDSLPGSARSTPRDWGSNGDGGGGNSAASHAAAAAAYLQQQQDYGGQQAPLLRAASGVGLHGGGAGHAAAGYSHQGQLLGREGSLRGGLASLGAKVLAGVGSPMDRLRRLSSGQYQQQHQQYQQQHLAPQQPPGGAPPPQMPLQQARQFR